MHIHTHGSTRLRSFQTSAVPNSPRGRLGGRSPIVLAMIAGAILAPGIAGLESALANDTQAPASTPMVVVVNAASPSTVGGEHSNSPAQPAHSAAPKDTRDGRVTINGVTISRPRFSTLPAGSTTQAMSNTQGGLIEVPSNTLGQGESLQSRNERLAAANRLAEATADLREQQANIERAHADQLRDARARGGSVSILGSRYGGGFGGGSGLGSFSGFGIETSALSSSDTPSPSISRSFNDEIHGQALKVFEQAALISPSALSPGKLNSESQRSLASATTLPLNAQQQARDEVQRTLRSSNAP